MSKIVYFVRHGQSEANLANVIAGSQIDSPLTSLGKEQAHDVADSVKGIKFDLAVASTLSRAKDTAHIILSDLESDLKIDERAEFIERDAKELTGTNAQDYFNKVEANEYTGESPASMRQRLLIGLKWLNEQDFDVALVATHNGTIRALKTIFDKLPPEDFNSVPVLKNGETLIVDVSTIDLD